MTRRAVALAPSDPMIGHPMVGDPVFDDTGRDGIRVRRACQYASAILKKYGLLPPDGFPPHGGLDRAPANRGVLLGQRNRHGLQNPRPHHGLRPRKGAAVLTSSPSFRARKTLRSRDAPQITHSTKPPRY